MNIMQKFEEIFLKAQNNGPTWAEMREILEALQSPVQEQCNCGFGQIRASCPVHGFQLSPQTTRNAESLAEKFKSVHASRPQMYAQIAEEHFGPIKAECIKVGYDNGKMDGKAEAIAELREKFEQAIKEWEKDKNKCERGWLGDHLRDRTFGYEDKQLGAHT